MGIAALGNSIVQLAERDKRIGWAATWVIRYRSGQALGLTWPIGRPISLANPTTGVGVRGCLGDPAGPMPATRCLDVTKVRALAGNYDISPEPLRQAWLRGPGYAGHDAVLFKSFRIVERVGFELRAEVNNVPNTPQWGNPRTDISNPRTFGTINRGGNQRTVRFTGKLSFQARRRGGRKRPRQVRERPHARGARRWPFARFAPGPGGRSSPLLFAEKLVDSRR